MTLSTKPTFRGVGDARPKHERTPPPTPEELAFVEDAGILFEKMAVPRMAGRIVGRLLIADPPEQSSAQLMRYLGASKGSISTMTRLLIQLGVVDRVGVPGERIDHFRLRPDAWTNLTRDRIRAITSIRELPRRAEGLPTVRRPRVRERIDCLAEFAVFAEREFPALLDRYEQHPDRSASGTTRRA